MMIYGLFVIGVGYRIIFSDNLLPLASSVLKTSDINLLFMGYPFNKVLIIIGQKYIGFKIMFKFAGLLRGTCPN